MRTVLAIFLIAAATAVTAQTHDHAPTALRSASRLSQDKAQSESWTYIDPAADFKGYRAVLVDDTALYSGPEADFGKISREDRVRYAGVFTARLRSELGKSITLASAAGPGVLRIKFTIIEMKETVGGVATATRVLPVGLAMSALSSLRDKPGRMTGSVLAAAEFTDSKSGKLLAAAVRRRSPDALNIKSTLSTEQTVEAVAGEFARRVAEALREAGMAG